MSRQTTNYGLTKPDYTDTADIEVVNANMDIIDGALKVIDTKSNNVMSKNSSAWSSTVTYAVGQYCIYNNSLWKSLVQHSGQTPQEGTYWARVSLDTLDSEINALNSNLDNISKYAYSTTGWADVFKQMGAGDDICIGMTNLHNAINTTYSSSGVYNVFANGPELGVVLMRTAAEFYSGLIVFYRDKAIAYSFARADGYFYARRI